ncbi:MAG: N-6 DNA methylase [Eubacteriales bacterium]|nr:N-6 DNA methylase [Eubacteriales bacterium]
MEDEIIKTITEISTDRSPHTVFSDWVELMAIATQNICCINHDDVWERREDKYKQILSGYKDPNIFPQMHGMLVEAFDDHISDYLGSIYMRLSINHKGLGQFFTPYHLSRLAATAGLPKEIPEIYKMNEPSCGGGGMVIATADEMLKRGINYQKVLKVVAQDLDWMAVHMCYVQLSLLGIDAVVIQGDSLAAGSVFSRPKNCIFRTPRSMGALW